ncbi:MAG: carboxypeptidase-like regulatory domain-containing protein [Pedobacter sp.]|uniref:carboxypeptidase-like regulatory domain-containing protein n=1 Tax=Pedobacter sp. TaxID=1411316 RepID=UPI00339AA1CC
MNKFYLLVAALCLLVSTIATAQNRTISGRVADGKNKETLIGVSVKIKGSTQGTSTDSKGNFSLSIPASNTNVVLIVNYVGYVSREITLGTQTTLNVELTSNETALTEVVVIGYGTVKKRDLTGSVVSVKGEDIAKVPSANPLESIQGKVPGVDVTRNSGAASSGVSINIRGTRSISAGNGPLIIVDGVQYSSLQDISSNDISSMEILKDASTTAI